MAAIQDIFAFRNISKAIESVKTGIPDRLPPAFNTIKEDVLGNETTYHTFYGERRLVQRTEYGAPSRATSQKPIGQKPLILASFASHILIEQELLLRLRQVNDVLAQNRAKDFIAKACVNHKKRYDNNRVAHQTQMLAKGAYWYDAQGNLLQSSSGAVVTVDFGVPAANKNQLNGIIGTSWADAAADIFLDIEQIKQRQVKATGRPVKFAFYGLNVPGYIYKNTSFKQYFQFNPQYFQQFAQNAGAIPDGFAGIDKWFPMRDTFFEDEAGTQAALWGDDVCTFTPDIDSDVYTLYEGSVICPTDMGVSKNVDGAFSNSEIVYGQGGYSVYLVDPVGVKVVLFDNVMPTWKNPLDMNIATVAF